MKVGIVTVFDSTNIGSVLQAIATHEMVKKNGDTPYIIKSRSSLTTLLLFLGYDNSKSARSLKTFKKFLSENIKKPRGLFRKLKKYISYKKSWSCFDKIISIKKANRLGMDVVLYGSDEIWNVRRPSFENPYLYGEGILSKKKVAYAISMGDAETGEVKKFPNLLEDIKNIDKILVRDFHTKDVLEECSVTADDKIPDPTLQTDITEKLDKPPAKKISGDYMVVYSYSVSEEIQKELKEFAKAHNVKTVAVSLKQNWCDEYQNCSPTEFGHILKNAKYVYTSTFHGTIFSVLYHTNFVARKATIKVGEVLELLGMEDRGYKDGESFRDFISKLEESPRYEKTDEIIKNMRITSDRTYRKYVKGIDKE